MMKQDYNTKCQLRLLSQVIALVGTFSYILFFLDCFFAISNKIVTFRDHVDHKSTIPAQNHGMQGDFMYTTCKVQNIF